MLHNLEEMENRKHIIFKTMVGSQAYGTSSPTSDIDIKGVYIQHSDDILSFNYLEQFEVSKDECYYEVRRFLQLLQSANPTVLEMLYMPSECVFVQDPLFDLIQKNRDLFLTKKCLHSFGGYAIAQINKAKGLNKKLNWEHTRVERKTLFDFCYVYIDGKTVRLHAFLEKENMDPKKCGLVKMDHFKDCYALYYSDVHSYNGILSETGTEVKLSSIPLGEEPKTLIHFNKEGFSSHCKDYNEYSEWLKNRNTQRYVDIEEHNQKIDGKNLLHCRRLLDMAIEIATEKTIHVNRPNAQYLLDIRKGKVDLNTIIADAEKDLETLDAIYAKSNLPDAVDKDFVNELLLKIRKSYV
ncbi:MAG: nucleotidyltransferase domain-containing protein [Leadbetterella sp.]